jgi:predicted MFS family arabinose efflux permease
MSTTTLEVAAPAHPAALPRTLPILAAANFAAASAGMIVAGLLQLIAQDLRWTLADAGRLIVLYALGFAIGAPLLGALLGQWCRKQVVVLGLSLVAIGSALGAVAQIGIALEGSRLIVAAGAALVVPSVSAIAAYVYPTTRARALAYVLAGMTLAVIVGLPFGTYLGGLWSWHAPLLGAAILASVVAVTVKLWLPGGIVVPPVPLATWGKLLIDRRTYLLVGLSVLYVSAVFVLYAYIAPFTNSATGVDADELALLLFWFGVVNFAANWVLAPLARRFRADTVIAVSIAGLAVALAAHMFSVQGVWVLVAAFAVWAVCSTLFGTLQQARVVDAAPAAGSAILALNTSATFAGQALGALIGGVVVSTGGVRWLPEAAGVMALLALVFFAVTRRVRLN